MSYQQKRQQVNNLISGLPYKQKAPLEIQILQLLHQINSLRPQVGNYVFNDGTMQQLFKLTGTIPIQHKSNQYNIPVELWLPLNFPKMCPIVYVTPVSGMKIKPQHMHVDSQGLVYHPFLHGWKAPQSNLVELAGILCSVFGKDPPLYTIKKGKKGKNDKNKAKVVHQIPDQQPPPEPSLNEIIDIQNKEIRKLKSQINSQKRELLQKEVERKQPELFGLELFESQMKKAHSSIMEFNSNLVSNSNSFDVSVFEERLSDFKSDIALVIQNINKCQIVLKPNPLEYQKWNKKQMVIWICQLQNGRFQKYKSRFIQGFEKEKIDCGDVLVDLQRQDLKGDPFNIDNFKDRRDICNHFQSLKNHNSLNDDNYEEGHETNYQ